MNNVDISRIKDLVNRIDVGLELCKEGNDVTQDIRRNCHEIIGIFSNYKDLDVNDYFLKYALEKAKDTLETLKDKGF